MGQQFLDLEGTKILANKIKENVKKINDIASGIGGRNLALGTGKAIGDVSSGTGGSPYSATDLFSGITAIKTNTAWAGRYFNLKAIAQRGGFKAGDNLVLSVYIKADQNVTLNVTCSRTKGTGNISGSSKSYTNFTVTPKWQQVWFPFVADEGSLNRVDARIEVNVATGNNYIHWAGWKLEKGTIATDWTPAPEDIDSAIDSKANKTDVYTKSEVYTKAQTDSAINGIQVGARNLMRNSKETVAFTNFTGGTNITMFSRKVYLTPDLKVGDKISVSLTYKYKNITLVSGQEGNARLYVQGSGNVTSWSPGFNSGPNVISNITKGNTNELTLYQTYTFTLSEAQLSNQYFDVGLRTDYIKTGSLSVYEMKVEKGSKSTAWSPAPEDIDTTLGNKANSNHNHDDRYYTESEINSKINTINNNISQLSNPNLLINGDFQVWQRGTSFHQETMTYCADRWLIAGENTHPKVEKTNNGVKITSTRKGGWTNFLTRLESATLKKLIGKTLTYTIKLKVPTKISQVWCLTGGIGGVEYHHTKGFSDKNYEYLTGSFVVKSTGLNDNVFLEFGIQGIPEANNSFEIEYAKLELGSVATPFVPRPYAEELALCQRYYCTEDWTKSNVPRVLYKTSEDWQDRGLICFPTEMRITPTINLVWGDNVINNSSYIGGKGIDALTSKSFVPYVNRTSEGVNNKQFTPSVKSYTADAEIY